MTMSNICECCGQPLRGRLRRVGKTYKAYADFVLAFNQARHACIRRHGDNWHLVPGASVWARIPAAWASVKVFGRVSHAPRDQRFPAAEFWPGGVLPIGPEYADTNTATIEIRRAA